MTSIAIDVTAIATDTGTLNDEPYDDCRDRECQQNSEPAFEFRPDNFAEIELSITKPIKKTYATKSKKRNVTDFPR